MFPTEEEIHNQQIQWEREFPAKLPHRKDQILHPFNPLEDIPVRVLFTLLINPHGRYIFYTPHLDIPYYGLPLSMHESIFYQLYHAEETCAPSPPEKSSSKTFLPKPPTSSISRLLKWLGLTR